jgi:hypothetical protein
VVSTQSKQGTVNSFFFFFFFFKKKQNLYKKITIKCYNRKKNTETL